jgi:hypothetical protein
MAPIINKTVWGIDGVMMIVNGGRIVYSHNGDDTLQS